MKALDEQDFKQKMVLFLDGELNLEESSTFLEFANQKPELMAQIQQEKSFRELLKQKARQRSASSELIQNIQSKISQRL
jgi:hypothetical protein